MHLPTHFSVVAFIVSALVYFLIGWLWYSNVLFGKPWRKESGMAMEGKAMPMLPMIGQLVFTLLYTLGIYMVVMLVAKLAHYTTIHGALVAGVSIIAFFVIPLNSGVLLFRKKTTLFSIDAGYQAVGAIVLSIILAIWK